MTLDIVPLVGLIAGSVTAVGGLYKIVTHLSSSSKSKKERYRQDILDHAKEEMSKIEVALIARIKDVEIELENQKQSMAKDIEHMELTYNNEIRSLGERIQELRNDLNDQHTALVALLTRLVDK